MEMHGTGPKTTVHNLRINITFIKIHERFYHIYTVTVMEANIKDGEG